MSEQSVGMALVTGANRGIGREVARQLVEHGYSVIVSAREQAKASKAVAELESETDGNLTALELDVADPASIARAAQSVRADPGRLDVLVNNAGVGSDFGVAGVAPDFDKIQAALDTNGVERSDAHTLYRAFIRGLFGQLGMPGFRRHRHGRTNGCEEAGGGGRKRNRLAGDTP